MTIGYENEVGLFYKAPEPTTGQHKTADREFNICHGSLTATAVRDH